MERTRKLQRGAVDLLAAAVGMTVIAIAVIGTSHTLLYSRQALINEEHYKVATYLLRGEMEEEMASFQLDVNYRRNPGSYLTWSRNPGLLDLDNPNDRDGHVQITPLEISREPVQKVDLIETGLGTDYYRLVMSASWQESFAAGSYGGLSKRDSKGSQHVIRMATTFIVRD